MRTRRALWLKSIEAAPLLPRSNIGTAVRHAITGVTKLAPLQLTIARGDTVVQVGAVGKGEIWEMARLVGPSGKVIAVEPAPDNLEAIRKRIADEGIRNVTVIPKGAWSEPGTQDLFMHPKFAGSHIMLASGSQHDRAMEPDAYAARVTIDVDRLDTILTQHGIEHCDFIKITVMGAEMKVLAGMDRLLAVTPKIWVKAHATIGGEPANRAISNLLRARGYRTVLTRGNSGPDGQRPGDVFATRL
ncbi:MAG TPA: FkbM family methyltransferase [Candidatus Baltobacteraceae bacterium]|nr:FkbM family methyltransferase [Candidatus Baltobacteraceae bacterium]